MTMSSSKSRKHTVVKPILEYEETNKGAILVKLHDDDIEFKQDLYRWCAMNGLSVHEKRTEFSLMRRIVIPHWLKEELTKTFELQEL